MAVVLTVAFTLPIAFLWHNLIGAVVVVVVGLAISALHPPEPTAAPSEPFTRVAGSLRGASGLSSRKGFSASDP